MKNKIIYIFTNETIPGLCKVGYTHTSIEQRLRELSRQTGVALPFECFYAKQVRLNVEEIEKWLHDLFKGERINPRKEFFKISPEKVVLALKYVPGEEIVLRQNVAADNQQEIKALQKAAKRRENFSFKSLKIPIGSKLTFIYDDKITCTVVSGRNLVEFQGKNISLAAAARAAYKKEYRLNGTLYWMYRGKTVDARRRSTEGEE
ncbi:MAG: GIY-YIG nuclease family protein [Patescibacteria group bacterium]